MKLIFIVALGLLSLIFSSNLFNKGYVLTAFLIPSAYILLCVHLYFKDGKSDD